MSKAQIQADYPYTAKTVQVDVGVGPSWGASTYVHVQVRESEGDLLSYATAHLSPEAAVDLANAILDAASEATPPPFNEGDIVRLLPDATTVTGGGVYFEGVEIVRIAKWSADAEGNARVEALDGNREEVPSQYVAPKYLEAL